MFQHYFACLKKDILIDFRRKENFIAIFFFSILVLLIFNFVLPQELELVYILVPGVYWVTFLFSGLLCIQRTFLLEKENRCITGLLLAPISRGVLLFAKLTNNLLFILLLQIILIPCFVLFFQVPIFDFLLSFFSIVFLASVGFCTLGTVLSAITANVRFNDILLPLLLFPLLSPVMLASVSLTVHLFSEGDLQKQMDWLKLLVAFDVIFISISYITFEFIIES